MALPLFTTSTYDTSKYAPVAGGLLFATHVEAVSVLRSMGADFMAMFGNKSALVTKKLDDAVEGAVAALREKAAAIPGIVGLAGVRVELSEVSRGEAGMGLLAVLASGTALKARPTVAAPTGGGGTRRRRRRRAARVHTTTRRSS